jgi:hypothetical protein
MVPQPRNINGFLAGFRIFGEQVFVAEDHSRRCLHVYTY